MRNCDQEQGSDRLHWRQTSNTTLQCCLQDWAPVQSHSDLGIQMDISYDQLDAEVQQQSSPIKKISNENLIRSRKQNSPMKRKQEDRQDPSYYPSYSAPKHKEDRKFEDWTNKLRNMMNIQLDYDHKGQRQSLSQFLLTIDKQSPDYMKRICTQLKNGYYKRELQLTKIGRFSIVGYINQFRKVKKYLPKKYQQAV